MTNSEKNDSSFRNRRKARELALQTLYACETGCVDEWDTMLDRIAEIEVVPAESKLYSSKLVSATLSSLAMLDELLGTHAANWELRRMAALDRNILRLAACELHFFPEVPFKVVIDEAVELAKIYGTDESSRFVNGIIDSIYKARQNTMSK